MEIQTEPDNKLNNNQLTLSPENQNVVEEVEFNDQQVQPNNDNNQIVNNINNESNVIENVNDNNNTENDTKSNEDKIEVDNKLIVKAGGINFQSYMFDRNKEIYGEDTDKYDKLEDIPFDEINIVSSKYKVNRAFRCKGGTLIDFQEKEIKVQEKHVDIYKNNVLK